MHTAARCDVRVQTARVCALNHSCLLHQSHRLAIHSSAQSRALDLLIFIVDSGCTSSIRDLAIVVGASGAR